MRFALDTNVLVYAEGLDGVFHRDIAVATISRLEEGIVIPAQVLGEFYNVLVRKAGLSRPEAHKTVLRWRRAYPILDTTASAVELGAEFATSNSFRIWDAIIVSVASQAGCRLLLSEDMQDGFTWGGVTIVNPFLERPNPLLAALLEPPAGPQG